MSIRTGSRGLAALAMIAAVASVGGGPNVLTASEPLPECDMPKAARGNGYRGGHRGSKPAFDRAKANRRRKLALMSKRRNRR